jgi:hypothetical protein
MSSAEQRQDDQAMTERPQGDGCAGGCVALFVAMLVIGAVIAAAISITALIDPFAWMPPVAEIWEDCSDDWNTEVNECDLHQRFPGFWVHAIVNLAYTVAATLSLFALAGTVSELRHSRPERFDSQTAADRYREAREGVTGLALLSGLLAALPIIVALV